MDKDLKNLFKKLEAQGWEVRTSKKGFWAIPPDETKPKVMIHGTANGSRSWQNMMAQLKRSGFIK
ncbi:hypothetical protein [Auritidibacter ignavus]|uniref:hypothetical protein n=1 Tax=Auritidibacter ignavus TaxID=678932 RepID=UPI002FE60A74